MPVTKRRKANHLVAGVTTLALSSALAVATAALASAEDNIEFDLPAGQACEFRLLVEGIVSKRIEKFTEINGNQVRIFAAGKRFDLTFTKLTDQSETVSSVEFPSNESVEQTTINVDVTLTVQSIIHNVVILFPSYYPPVPSTTLYTIQLVYTVDTFCNFDVQSTSGPTTDICALFGP